ncbi:MAG: hemolysin III family protein [Desulfuromonadales bacterium]|nr:hemolysin III family protein [Desulfuromonadales bacterium]
MYPGERFNSITHLVGAVAAAIGLVVLLVVGAEQGDAWRMTSFAIYGTTLVVLFTLSTLYHSFRAGRKKAIFRRLEHCGIYVLIAGTYTPFGLVTLRESWGLTLLAINWGLAVTGILYEHLSRDQRRILPVVLYLLMGWLLVVAWVPLARAIAPTGLILIVLGGLFYSSGIVFYAFDYKWRFFHGIWHLFVLAGSASHYFAILLFVG